MWGIGRPGGLDPSLTPGPYPAIFNHMVNSRTQQLDEDFFALSDPTRRQMLARLASGDMTVAELSEPFDVSAPAIPEHLRVLERAGLLTRERERAGSPAAMLVADPLKEAAEWVQQYRRVLGSPTRSVGGLPRNNDERTRLPSEESRPRCQPIACTEHARN